MQRTRMNCMRYARVKYSDNLREDTKTSLSLPLSLGLIKWQPISISEYLSVSLKKKEVNFTHLDTQNVVVTSVLLVAKPSIDTFMSTLVSSRNLWFPVIFLQILQGGVPNPIENARGWGVPALWHLNKIFWLSLKFLKSIPVSPSCPTILSPARIVWGVPSRSLPAVPVGLLFCSSWVMIMFICPASHQPVNYVSSQSAEDVTAVLTGHLSSQPTFFTFTGPVGAVMITPTIPLSQWRLSQPVSQLTCLAAKLSPIQLDPIAILLFPCQATMNSVRQAWFPYRFSISC